MGTGKANMCVARSCPDPQFCFAGYCPLSCKDAGGAAEGKSSIIIQP